MLSGEFACEIQAQGYAQARKGAYNLYLGSFEAACSSLQSRLRLWAWSGRDWPTNSKATCVG